MKSLTIITGAVLLSASSLYAQRLPETVKREDNQALVQQYSDLYKNVLDPISAAYSKHTVAIKNGNKVVAMGTVTDKGIVTKLSEIQNVRGELRMVDHEGNGYPVKMKSTNEDYDLALLDNPGKLKAVTINAKPSPDLGAIIIAAGAADQALSMGVVSVKARSLREADKGFLGVVMEMEPRAEGGVKLRRVEDYSAASRAGLKAGDVIITVDGKPVNNIMVMRSILQKQKPGSTITVSYKRDGQVVAGLEVTLGARKDIPVVRRSRMNSMKRMGGKVNKIGSNFPAVLQTDMELKSHLQGAPIIDIDGNFVGVAIARSSRIKTYIIEAKKLQEIFNDIN